MAVDWNLDLGNIITFALVIIGGVGAFFAHFGKPMLNKPLRMAVLYI